MTCIYKVVFFFVALAFVAVVQGESPKLVESSYQIKSTVLFGVEINVAVFNLTFDQDLYLPDAINCPGLNCSAVPQDECICDYTNITSCGTLISGGSNCTCNKDLCDPSQYEWTDLKENSTLYGEVDESHFVHYRLFINTPCTGFKISIYQLYGDPWMSVNTKQPSIPKDAQYRVRGSQRPLYQNICPTYTQSTVQTYFITIRALDAAAFYIKYSTMNVEAPTDVTPCSPIPSLPNHQCIADSIPYHGVCEQAEDTHWFVYELKECGRVKASLSFIEKNKDFDLYGWFEDTNLTWTISDLTDYELGESSLVTTVCPREGETSRLIYFMVSCYQIDIGGENAYTLYISTKHPEDRRNVAIASLPPLAGVYALQTSSHFVRPNTDVWLVCENWVYGCTSFWHLFPQTDPNGFWPFSPGFAFKLNQRRFGRLSVKEDLNSITIQPRTHLFAIVVSYVINDVTIQLFDTALLSQGTVEFNGLLTNKEGDPVVGSYTAKLVPTSCSKLAFDPLKRSLEEKISELNSLPFEAIDNSRFEIETAKFKNAWAGCDDKLKNLILAEQKVEMKETKGCSLPDGTPEFLADPCCSSVASWKDSCVPRIGPVRVVTSSLNLPEIENTCSNPACLVSLLKDYTENFNPLVTESKCRRSDPSYYDGIYESYRACKSLAFSNATCFKDSECSWEGMNYPCDISHQRCLIPFSERISTFLTCIIESLDAAQEQYFRTRFNITVSKAQFSTFYERVKAAVSSQDCVYADGTGFDINLHTHYSLEVLDSGCAVGFNCGEHLCEDQSCLVPENSCLIWCKERTWTLFESSETECGSDLFCNWNSTLCSGKTKAECEQLCTTAPASTHFCGYCENGRACIEYAVDESACNSTRVCVLPSGTVLFNLTESECAQYGECSSPCPVSCESDLDPSRSGVCFSTELNETNCLNVSGRWDSNTSTCFFDNKTAISCPATFQSCHSLGQEECVKCQTNGSCPINQKILRCHLIKPPCTSQAECESAGFCSDQELLADISSDVPFWGRCVVGKTDPVDQYDGQTLFPFCLPISGQLSFPNGCIDPVYENATDCEANGGTWVLPSLNETSCTEPSGCYERHAEKFTVGNQFAFSPKSPAACNVSGGNYKSYFEWKQPEWVPGAIRKLSWLSRKAETTNVMGPSVNFGLIQEAFFEGAFSKMSVESVSQILCDHTRSVKTLSSVSCACAGDQTDQNCFSQSPTTVIGQGEICTGEQKVVSAPGIDISFDNNQMTQGCTVIVISQIPALHFQVQQNIPLYNSFAELASSSSIQVLNTNRFAIGNLVGDGFYLEFSGPFAELGSFSVCIKADDKIFEDYPVKDFAQTDASFSSLVPLESSVHVTGGKWCVNVSSPRSTLSFFPMLRLKDWVDAMKDPPYTTDQRGGMYFLAACYFLALIPIIVFLTGPASSRKKVLFALFLVIDSLRGIHLVLHSDLDSANIGTFFLSDFPSFLFFSTFTIMIYDWAALRLSIKFDSKHKPRLSKKSLRALCLGINLFIYAVLLVLLLLFEFLPETRNTSNSCGTSAETTLALTDTVKFKIAITYKAVLVFINLLSTVAFLGYGFMVRSSVSQLWESVKNNRRKMQARKFFQITSLGGICFLLQTIVLIFSTAYQIPASGLISLWALFTVLEIAFQMFLLSMLLRRSKLLKKAIGKLKRKQQNSFKTESFSAINDTTTANSDVSAREDTGRDEELLDIRLAQIPSVDGPIQVGSALGAGNFGAVFKGTLQNQTVALKQPKEKGSKEIFNEALFLMKLDHPNILKLYGKHVSESAFFLVFEFMNGEDLSTFLLKREESAFPLVLRISLHLASALSALEEKNFVHGDVAARNVLLEIQEGSIIAKLSDFGSSKELGDKPYYQNVEELIPVRWCAPEALSYGRFSVFTDVYAYGVTLWEILSGGDRPFAQLHNHQIFEQVPKGLRLSRPTECKVPDDFWDLITSCWKKKAAERPSFKSIVEKLKDKESKLNEPIVVPKIREVWLKRVRENYYNNEGTPVDDEEHTYYDNNPADEPIYKATPH